MPILIPPRNLYLPSPSTATSTSTSTSTSLTSTSTSTSTSPLPLHLPLLYLYLYLSSTSPLPLLLVILISSGSLAPSFDAFPKSLDRFTKPGHPRQLRHALARFGGGARPSLYLVLFPQIEGLGLPPPLAPSIRDLAKPARTCTTRSSAHDEIAGASVINSLRPCARRSHGGHTTSSISLRLTLFRAAPTTSLGRPKKKKKHPNDPQKTSNAVIPS